jgi:hypothetical protein
MMTHTVGVAPDTDDLAVVHDPIDEGNGHHFVPEDIAPFRNAFFRGITVEAHS